ncbi:MAG: glycoside hydrolase family 28 protein [Chitinophagaceae bacterium]
MKKHSSTIDMSKNIFLKTISCLLLLSAFITLSPQLSAAPSAKFNPFIAPGTLTESSVTLLWDKQVETGNAVYEIYLNNKPYGTTRKTNYTITKLLPNTQYTVKIVASQNKETVAMNTIVFKTTVKGKVYNILDFGAKDDTLVKNTRAIQAAIDACTEGGTVYIPKGTYISGALFLKSNMTLYIEKDAVLKGSVSVDDYLPMIPNRFEGWEMKTYASLLNAGTLSRNGGYSVTNLRITGEGTLEGGGKKLGDAMIKAEGIRSRGRLLLLMNCQDVSISGITLTQPPSWTLHYIYSDNISCHGLRIITRGIRNGDGIDPDSSTDSYIFNCSFDTGDDCIAIKSGKNPEGFYVGKPTKNVRVTDCDFIYGHGISIGSEMSGGVSDVLIQDCQAGNLLNGMQIKGTKERGGYVRNVTVSNCQLMKITVFSALNYNNDGEAAPEVPVFENFVFRNIDMKDAKTTEPVMIINGFKEAHHLRNLTFSKIVLPDGAKILINDAEKATFTNVKTVSGAKPVYTVNNSTEIVY